MQPYRSPFPGMDPWLEHPRRWRDVHSRLVTYLCDDLQSVLPARYYARMEDRVYVDLQEPAVAPHVRVVERPPLAAGAGGGVAVLEADPAVVVKVSAGEVEERFIEVRDLESGDRVVTVVEVLSPSNKRPGSPGAVAYRGKQAEVLASAVNLVEIDLLRGGEHIAAVPCELLGQWPPFDYLVVVRRAERPHERELYPARLRSPLPRLAVPLRSDERDVVADLQSLVERAYERGAYWKTIDYSQPPVPSLPPAEEAWARECVARKGP